MVLAQARAKSIHDAATRDEMAAGAARQTDAEAVRAREETEERAAA